MLGAVLTGADLPRVVPARSPTDAGPADGASTAARPGDRRRRRGRRAGACQSWLLRSPGVSPRFRHAPATGSTAATTACQEVCPPNWLADRRHDGPPTRRGGRTERGPLLDARSRRRRTDGSDPSLVRASARPRPPASQRLGGAQQPADGGDGTAVGLLRRYLRHRDDNLVARGLGGPEDRPLRPARRPGGPGASPVLGERSVARGTAADPDPRETG